MTLHFAKFWSYLQALIQGIFITAQNSVSCSFCVKRVWQKGVAIGLAKSLENRDCMKCKTFNAPDSDCHSLIVEHHYLTV